MNKKKIITASFIFTAMFTSAWAANEKTKRTYIDPDSLSGCKAEISETEEPFYLSNEEKRMLEKFKPREYIRIVNVNK
ncbi:hypothetical protein M4D55_18545 [Metabacillus idriensis]|uniref:hypothetical protein n=1 Tax=Metabacillus idriensis TaxID=324768 RepID=UPI00203ED35B|nr:hypothetical protein [Metabacillus idriensis]MCM3597772.1 hypothetical protein [Metabacillus idriensis]